MIFEINTKENKKVRQFYEESMQELDEFFELGWKYNRPKVVLVPDRKTIDALKGEKSEDWVTGWSGGDAIYVLAPENFGKESHHTYSDRGYSALIKHELAHCFIGVISRSKKVPRWLNEGIAIYLSGQLEFKKRPKRLDDFLKFHEEGGREIYRESGFAVEFLVKEYGKEKILTLLKRSKEAPTQKEFKNLFEDVYGFELSYDNFKLSTS